MQTGKSISYKTSNLFYWIGGEGKTVVLIHGFGEDGSIWNEIAEVLQKSFLVITPDIPGSGKSDILKEDQHTISIDDYAEAIKYILDAESIDACTIIGHSMGGYITLAFAEKYPDCLNSIGLFHSSAFADDDEKIQTRLKAIEFIKNNGSHAFLKTSVPSLFTENFCTVHPEEVEKLINAGNKFNPNALIQYHRAMISRPDRPNTLKHFPRPVLFIAGEKDKTVPLETSLKQSHLPQICHFLILTDSAHMGMLEEKEKTISILVNFLSHI